MFFFLNFSSLSPLSFGIYATASSPPIIPLLSFPTHTLLLLCSFFIHSYFTASTAIVSHPIELELFLIIIFLVASICIPPAFLPKGISLLSLTLSPLTPPSFWLVPSRLFSCAIHSSSSPPSQFVSLWFFFSFSVLFLSVFPPQSLVMRCDKPCYHSNKVS